MSRLPSEYKELQYIESSGTQYIDTGILPSNNTKVELELTSAISSSNFSWLFGARNIASAGDGYMFGSATGGYLASDYNGSRVSSTDKLVINNKYWVCKDGNICTYNINNGSAVTLSNTASTFTVSKSLYLFNFNRDGTISSDTSAYGKLYYTKIWNNGVLQRNLIPAERTSDNVLGMYDLANSGKNIFDKSTMTPVGVGLSDIGYARWATGTAQSRSYVLPIKPNTNYNISVQGTFEGSMFRVATTATKCTSTSQTVSTIAHTNKTTYSATTVNSGANAKYMYIQFSAANIEAMGNILMVVEGTTTPSEYEPYPFYTNRGTGSFIAGPYANQYFEISKSYYKKPYRLPSEYTELEYIQSSGTQYIDTGIKSNQSTRALYSCAVIDDLTSKDSHIFGARTNASLNAFDLAFMNAGSQGTLRFIHGGWTDDIVTPLITSETIHNKHAYDMSGTYVKVDDTTVMTFTTASFTGEYNLWIGGVNNAGTLHNQTRSQKIYECKIWQDGSTLTCDFIPARRNSDLVVGMYDMVSDTFFTNSGTDSFIAGDPVNTDVVQVNKSYYVTKLLPDEYQELEYIQSSGTQYIDTGLYFVADDYIEIDLSSTVATASLDNSFYGCYTSGRICELGVISGKFRGNVGYNGPVCIKDTRYKVTLESGYWTYNGESFGDRYNTTITAHSNLLFCRYYNGVSKLSSMRCYSLIHKRSGVEIGHFIPAQRISDSEIGMYDIVTKQFFTNSGTGDFTPGPEVTNYKIYEINNSHFFIGG